MPVLLNTSFNVAGQPIVETPMEAIETFLRTDIDYLALEGRWIRRRHQPVKDYAEHICDLEIEDHPHGLPAGQPSVDNMMHDLDSSIFMGSVSKNWTEKEIESLSEQCGRYKETSSSFHESPFLAPLETQVGSNATIIVNPRGHSVLVDETGKQVEVLSLIHI